MADAKISALTSATTPLAGTEVLPIVQSSTTKKVSVANLTVGRSVTTGPLSTYGTSSGTPGVTVITDNGSYVTTFTQYRWTGGAADQYYATRLNCTADSNYKGVMEFQNSGGSTIGSHSFTTNVTIDGAGNLVANTGNFVQGTAAKGINFTANTPAAGKTSQLLNYYEEGTWTPAANVITFSSASGRYTRVGRMILAQATVKWPVTADTNGAQITGFPFTPAVNSAGSLGYNTSGIANPIYPHLEAGTTKVEMFSSGGGVYTNANFSNSYLTLTIMYIV